MKSVVLVIVFILTVCYFFFASCNTVPKQLAGISIGMNKQQVTGLVGEPKQKNTINKTEIWDYPDSSRTVVFRMDTVYSILTSPQARADSLGKWVTKTGKWLGKTDNKIAEGLDKLGDKIDSTGKKIDRKLSKP